MRRRASGSAAAGSAAARAPRRPALLLLLLLLLGLARGAAAAAAAWEDALTDGDLDDMASLLVWHTPPRRLLVQDAARAAPDLLPAAMQLQQQMQQAAAAQGQQAAQAQAAAVAQLPGLQGQQDQQAGDRRLPMQLPAHVRRLRPRGGSGARARLPPHWAPGEPPPHKAAAPSSTRAHASSLARPAPRPHRPPPPPQVYLISFVLLLTVMLLLLSCHCWRLCRMAQRMEASYLASAAAGGPGYYASKRATPEDVITALPVRRFGSFVRAAEAAKVGGSGGGSGSGGEVELAAAAGGGAGDAARARDQAPEPAAAGGGQVAAVFDAEEPCAVCYEDFEEQAFVKQLPCGGCEGRGG
jgi:hypothetical protein